MLDCLTQCYRSRMRLFNDDPVGIPGRWRWCPPDAVDLPYFHAFGSQFDESDQARLTTPPIGEQAGFPAFTDGGGNPRYTGQGWCGPQSVWENGDSISNQGSLVLDAEGVPVCCPTTPIRPGGAVCNGTLFDSVPLYARGDSPTTIFPAITTGSWENQGGLAENQFVLSTANDATQTPVPWFVGTAAPFSGNGCSGRFVIGPLKAQTIHACDVVIQAGWQVTLRNAMIAEAAVALNTFTPTGGGPINIQELVVPTAVTGVHIVMPGYNGVVLRTPVPETTVSDGDYLALEVGIAWSGGAIRRFIGGNWNTNGATLVPRTDRPAANPQAVVYGLPPLAM